MSNAKLHPILFLLPVLGFGLAGCGASPSTDLTAQNSLSDQQNSQNTPWVPVTVTPLPSPSATPTGSGTLPLYQYRVDGVGYAPTTPVTVTVQARNMLRVKFTPGIQDRTPSGSGQNADYAYLGAFLTVGTRTQATPLLSNGLAAAAQSTIIDFSSAITGPTVGGCNISTDSTCRRTVTITVSKPNYDYYCYNYGVYCPYTNVLSTHPWNAQLDIQTDDTVGQ